MEGMCICMQFDSLKMHFIEKQDYPRMYGGKLLVIHPRITIQISWLEMFAFWSQNVKLLLRYVF